ncbi:MAG: hypothetical protein QME49_04325 [bacterium]|nr:hypothetical protein [bacterium]
MCKKGLLLMVVFVGMLCCVSAYADTTGNGNQTVDATPVATLALTVPGGANLGAISIAAPTESSAQVVNVKSNAAYGIRIKADKTNMANYCPGSSTCTGACTGGTAAGYATTADKVVSLQSALQWKKEVGGTYANITVTDVTVSTAQAATVDAGVNTNIYFKQAVNYGDRVLTDIAGQTSHTYRLVITYTATQGI